MRTWLLPLSLLALAACDRAPVQAPSAALPQTAAQQAEHWWVCGEVSVSTEMQGEMLTLSGPFGERALSPQPSASGARYADDKGNEFWNKGEEARLKLDWKDIGDCTESKSS